MEIWEFKIYIQLERGAIITKIIKYITNKGTELYFHPMQ